MSIQLTPEQLEALDTAGEDAARLIDPRTNAAYRLVGEAEYKTVREILEDEQRQRTIRAIALKNAIGRMDQTP